MTFQPSEIADLLMMLVLGPMVLIAVHRAAPALAGAATVCLGLMAMGYIATVVESVAYPSFFNLIEHASYAAAGFAFVWLLKVSGQLVRSGKAGHR